MAKRTAWQAQETVATIVDQAREVFINKGFAQASLAEIATRAEVTRGALYHHFANKTDLFKEVIRLEHEKIAAVVLAQADKHTALEDKLIAGCQAFLRESTKEASGKLLLFEAAHVLGWQQWRTFDQDASVKTLRLGLKNLVPDSQLEASVVALSGAMNDLALWIMESGRSEAVLDTAEKVLLKMLESLIGASARG